MRRALNPQGNARRPSTHLRMAVMALVCVIPAGCGYYSYEPLDTPDTEGFLLQPVSMTHEIQFLPDQAKVALEEKERLQAFVEEVDPKNEAEFWVDAAGDQGEQRRDAVVHALEHLGRTDAAEGATTGRSNVVTVTVRRHVVLPKSCLDPTAWPDPRLLPASCSNMLNLLASVESQSDLIQGREAGLASGAAAATALETLRKKAPSEGDGARTDHAKVTLSAN